MLQSQKHSETMVNFSKHMLSNKQKGDKNTSWETPVSILVISALNH